MIKRICIHLGAALLFALAMPLAQAQGVYPAKPIRLIVPFGAGGVTDATARVFAEGLTRELGQPVVVENRAGAGGGIAAGFVSKAPADGYTLLVITNGMYAVNPWIYPQLAYDPDKDFVYIAMLANTPTVLAVGSGSPYSSLKELLAVAATEDDKLSFSTAGAGSDNYQVLQLLQQATGVRMMHVPFKSGADSLTAVLSSTVDATAISAVTGASFIESGQVRAFAVTSGGRLENLPQIPTVKEVLGQDLEAGSLSGIAAPAGTPVEIVERLNRAIAAVAGSDLAREKIYARGSQAVDSSQDAFQQRIRQERKKWAQLLGG
ncbi:tripartite tricarboxylate transporter substrate binding protein [Alcaligenes sp. Marseille-Q7550]